MENSPGNSARPHHRLPEFSSLLRPESRAMAKPSLANRTPKDSLSPGENAPGGAGSHTPSMLPAESAVTMRQLYMGESRSSTSSSLSDSLSDFYSSPEVREGMKKEKDKEVEGGKKDDKQADGCGGSTRTHPSDESGSGSTGQPTSQGLCSEEVGEPSTPTRDIGGIEESAPGTDSATDSEETESEQETEGNAELAEVRKVNDVTIEEDSGANTKAQLTLHLTPDSVESDRSESPLVKYGTTTDGSSANITGGDKSYTGTFSVVCANNSLQDLTHANIMSRVRARVRVGFPDWSSGLSVGNLQCNTPKNLLDGSEEFPSLVQARSPFESHDALHTPPLMVPRSPSSVAVTEQPQDKCQDVSMLPSLPVSSSIVGTQWEGHQQPALPKLLAGGKTPDTTSWIRKSSQPLQYEEAMTADSNTATFPANMSYPYPGVDADMMQEGVNLMWNQSPELIKEATALLEPPQLEAKTSSGKPHSAWKFTYTHPWDFSPRKKDESLAVYQAKPSQGPVQNSVSSDLATEEHLVRMTGQVPMKTSADVTQQTWSGCPTYTSSSTPHPTAMPPAVTMSQPAHNNLNLLSQAAQEQAATLSSLLPGQQFLVYLVPGPPDAAGTPGPPTLLYVPHTPGMAAPVIHKDIMQHGHIQGLAGKGGRKSGYLFIPVRPDPLSSAQFQTGYIGQPIPTYTNMSQEGGSFPQVQKTLPDSTPQLYNAVEQSVPSVSTAFHVKQGSALGEISHTCPVYNAVPTSSTYSSHMTTAPMRGNSVGLLRKPRRQLAGSSTAQYSTQPGNVEQPATPNATFANPSSIRYNMMGCFTDVSVASPGMARSASGMYGPATTVPGTSVDHPYPVQSALVQDNTSMAAAQGNWRQMYPGQINLTQTKQNSLLRQHLQSSQAALGNAVSSASISSVAAQMSLGNSRAVNSNSTITGNCGLPPSVENASVVQQSEMASLMNAGTSTVKQASSAASVAKAVEGTPAAVSNTREIREPTAVRSEVPESTTGHIPTTSHQKVDPRMHPPRHYEFRSIQVGTWKVEHRDADVGQTAKIKLLFASRKLVYEFQLNSAVKAHDMGMRQLASVEIPFKTVVAINTKVDKLILEVCEVPRMYFGTRICPREGGAAYGKAARYRRDQRADITGGQLQAVPYHTIELHSGSAVKKVRGYLERFDPSFVTMMRTALVIDPNKRLSVTASPLVPVVTQPPSCPLGPRDEWEEGDIVPPPPKRQNISDSCSCSTGCSSRRCGCWACMRSCESNCVCTNCNNPLMILRQFGVNIESALEDDCLVVNFSKVADLREHLQTLYHLPCCGAMVKLLDMIPGYRTCPECHNKAVYSYSWCNFVLCDQNKRPRNHCTKCRKCKDFRDVHCQKCNTCYFAGALGEQKCPCTLRQRTSPPTTGNDGFAGFFQFLVGNQQQQQQAAQVSTFVQNQPEQSSSNRQVVGSGSEA